MKAIDAVRSRTHHLCADAICSVTVRGSLFARQNAFKDDDNAMLNVMFHEGKDEKKVYRASFASEIDL